MVVLSRPARSERLLRALGPARGRGGRAMIWAAVLAGALGAGLWLIARALVPPARPLRSLADELVEPRAAAARACRPRRRRPAAVAPARRPPGRRPVRAPGRRPRRARPHAGRATCSTSSATPCCSSAWRSCRRSLFPMLDVGVPVLTTLVGALLFAAAGWCYPDVEVRSRAVAARRSWSQALTVYVDIVGISLAGGAGVEDALMVAARAGTGPQFAELDATLRAAQTRRRKLWHALDELGARADILPLRELASAVDLAAESGSRIRETLLAKANAMRIRQLTDAEADAQKASETMGIAPALMAIAAVVLIGYPAVARFFEMSSPPPSRPTDRPRARRRRQGAPRPCMLIQIQIITACADGRGTAWPRRPARVRDDERGELTGNVIFLAALAVAAAAVGAIIIARLNSNADKVP